MDARNTTWNGNVWYFALFQELINFMAESAPGSRNLHLKFIFFRGDILRPDPL